MTAPRRTPTLLPKMLAAGLILCAVPTRAGAEPHGQIGELDSLVSFANPAMCYLSETTDALFASFYANDPAFMHEDGWFVAGSVPESLRDRLGPVSLITHDSWWTVRTEARGTLWGLRLVAIEQDFPIGGDPGAFAFVFDAPLTAVEAASRARGFVARAGQTVPMGEPDGYDYTITLELDATDNRFSRLSCGYA